MRVARTVVGVLAVACFAGGGYLVSGVHQATPAPAQIDQTKIWSDLQQRADQLRRDLQQQGPATPTPVPTHETERSV